ncbi:bifunctional AP-4-A phosphorylase/ADP sulfurylase, partial [Ascosphaera atra]
MASPRTSLAIARLCSDLPSNLPTLVASRFDEARQKGALTLSGISVRTVRCGNVPFLLQYCPALSKKPTPGQEKKQKQENTEPKGEETENEGQAKEKPQQKKKFNPFENPDPNLVISDVPLTSPDHYLILNKFPIISGHFILATKECKPQTHFLEKSDLEVAFAVLKAWELRSNTQQK